MHLISRKLPERRFRLFSKVSFYEFLPRRADKHCCVQSKVTMVEELRNIKREVLPNGLTILTEEMQHIRSVSIGIWVKTGSRHEDPHVNGISHFLEHMVFKGTKDRTAADIARQMD